MGGKATLIWILVAITTGHLIYRSVEGRREPVPVSRLSAPMDLPDLALEGGQALSGEACQLLVFFRPTCPFCEAAAARESQRADLEIPRTWIAESRAEAEAFHGLPHATSGLTWSTVAGERLEISAVPAAVLVAGDRVLGFWSYRGEEQDHELAVRCERSVAGPTSEGQAM